MFKAEVKNIWAEYSSNACIHGVKFLSSRQQSNLARTLWLSTMIIAGYTIVNQVWTNWLYYKSYPMQVVESATRLPLSKINFPAVTICSVFKVKYDRAIAHIDRVLGSNATEEDIHSYWNTLIALAILHYPHYDFPWKFIKEQNVRPYPINNRDIPEILEEVGHKAEDIFHTCSWRGLPYNCSQMFWPQRTEEGFCLSFNSATSLIGEYEFYNQSNISTFVPLRNTAAGKHTGLELALKAPDEKFYYPFQRFSMGYNIIIHNSWDYPDISNNIQISRRYSQVQRIYVKPVKDNSHVSIRDVPHKVRGCNWFPNVLNSLEADKNYCFIICRRNATLEMCNCLPLNFEPQEGSDYCDLSHLECLINIQVKLRNYEYDYNSGLIRNTDGRLICNCYRTCTYIFYDLETAVSTINLPSSSRVYARVDVSYKDRFGRENRREVKYTFKDFSANIGGLASLMLGCSVISLLEIFTYLCKLGLAGLRAVSPKLGRPDTTKTPVLVQPLPDYPFLH